MTLTTAPVSSFIDIGTPLALNSTSVGLALCESTGNSVYTLLRRFVRFEVAALRSQANAFAVVFHHDGINLCVYTKKDVCNT